jgi:hypothetical protein
MTQVIRKMTAIGLAQGFLLWLLAMLLEHGWWSEPYTWAWFGLGCLVVSLPLLYYLTENLLALSRRRRAGIVLGLSLLVTLIAVLEFWIALDGARPQFNPGPPLAAAILAFVGVPLLTHLRTAPNTSWRALRQWRWSYPDLFQTTWRNVIAVFLAVLLTLICWLVIGAGAALLRTIGAGVIGQIMLEPSFAVPVTAVVFGGAMGMVLKRADTIVVLRRFWLSLNKSFLPVLLLFLLVWACLLPILGIPALLQESSASISLIGFIALAITFANAAFQDGIDAQPYSPRLRMALRFAWLATLPALAIAVLPLGELVASYGWTLGRVWAAFIWLLAAGYVLGYALSIYPARPGWMWSIAPTNIAMALFLCAGLLVLVTPIADARRLAAASQTRRLVNGDTAPIGFDYEDLARNYGRYGQRALQRLSRLPETHPHADVITTGAQLALLQRATHAKITRSPDENGPGRWHMVPDGAPAQPAVEEALRARMRDRNGTYIETDCVRSIEGCRLWLVDLDGDAREEVVLIHQRGQYWSSRVYRWIPDTGVLESVGSLPGINQAWMDAVQRGEAKPAPSRWRDVAAGNTEVRLLPDYRR